MIPFLFRSLTFVTACKKNKSMKSTDAPIPVAEKQPTNLEKHGDVRIDDYFWMRLSDDQKNAAEKMTQLRELWGGNK